MSVLGVWPVLLQAATGDVRPVEDQHNVGIRQLILHSPLKSCLFSEGGQFRFKQDLSRNDNREMCDPNTTKSSVAKDSVSCHYPQTVSVFRGWPVLLQARPVAERQQGDVRPEEDQHHLGPDLLGVWRSAFRERNQREVSWPGDGEGYPLQQMAVMSILARDGRHFHRHLVLQW